MNKRALRRETIEMLTQASLPHSGSRTSRAAADSMRSRAPSIQERVYRYIALQGETGATEEEIEEALHLNGNTCRPRVWQLIRDERVEDSGALRKTRSGRHARVVRVRS